MAGLALLIAQEWYWGTAGLVVGYFLQFVGHRVEGNDVGEWAAVKRALRPALRQHFAAMASCRRREKLRHELNDLA